MSVRDVREPVVGLTSNYNIFSKQDGHYSNDYRPAKKLPTPPIKTNQSSFAKLTTDCNEKTINAQPKSTHNNAVPFTPYTGTSLSTTVKNNQNSAICSVPVSTSSSPKMINSTTLSSFQKPNTMEPKVVTLPEYIQIHKEMKNVLVEELKTDMTTIKNELTVLRMNWDKTGLNKSELKTTEDKVTTTYKTAKKFRDDSQTITFKDKPSIDAYLVKKDLLAKELDYTFDLTYYYKCVKRGEKPLRPIEPSETLTSYLAKSSSTKKATSTKTTSIPTKNITNNNSKVTNSSQFTKMQKEGWKFAYKEDDGVHVSVSPGCGFIGGEKIVTDTGESRIIRIRDKEEDKEFHAFLASCQ